MEYKEVYESWLANPYFDEATKQELLSIKDDENEIKERFYADLEFGIEEFDHPYLDAMVKYLSSLN